MVPERLKKKKRQLWREAESEGKKRTEQKENGCSKK